MTVLNHLLCLLVILTPSTLAAKNHKTYIIHVRLPEDRLFNYSNENLESFYKSFTPNNSSIVFMYRNVMNGFAARLTPQELEEMEKVDGFLYARPAKKYELHTTRTPSFLGLHQDAGPWRSPANFGKGVIIGVLDTGITPGHPSFSDHDMPPPPPKWRGRCEFNSATTFSCNNKIIGARSFIDNESPFDQEGHGTFTASTAAGNFVPGANVFGQANGTASGMAPLAHLAIYKLSDFEDSTILAAIDAAIEDGVDVLSMSFASDRSTSFYDDSIAIGSFAAMSRDIFVSCSAGNFGPRMSTLFNEAPWILTVGASTLDREIRGVVKLGNHEEIEGETLGNLSFSSKSLPLVNIADQGIDVEGKIVFSSVPLVDIGAAAGILANENDSAYTISLIPDKKVPSLVVSSFGGEKIKAYINSTSNPVATISFIGTVLGVKTAPTVGSFSSRGPNLLSPGILKPDIIGPGVNIVAAWHKSVDDNTGSKGAFYNVDSGTSYSCPHLSGIAALLKSSHPDWSPAMIKSAIMTTATQVNLNKDLILDERHVPANIFAVGAGHVNPSLAMDPGLVYDISSQDYISYLCALYDEEKVELIVREKINCTGSEHQGITEEAELNYPSFAVQLIRNTSRTYSRTVTNVGDANSSYHVENEGFSSVVETIVEPTVLVFTKANQKITYKVNFIRTTDFTSTNGSDHYYVQGSIAWLSAKHKVRIPVSVTV